jgi:hypothetical protein
MFCLLAYDAHFAKGVVLQLENAIGSLRRGNGEKSTRIWTGPRNRHEGRGWPLCCSDARLLDRHNPKFACAPYSAKLSLMAHP